MVVSWARAIMSISKKAWTFPARPYHYILSFPKINRKPNNSKTEGRKGHTGPPGQPRGEELPAGSFLILTAPEGTYWGPGATPWEEELPCRFLSHPMTLSRTAAAPNNQLFIGFYYWIRCHFLGYIHMLLDFWVSSLGIYVDYLTWIV